MTDSIGRFEIRRLLGKGAQSSVYLGFDPHLEREVAIKTLHFARRDPAQNQFLLQEARTVSKMRHPHIVPIFEAGEEGGDPYLVFEYVEGSTLAQVVQAEGALSPERAAGIMLPVLDAVAYAHRFGTIHRDLKPSNILMNGEGVPRVMDFGIASKVSADAADEADQLLGTPAYMSPEYAADRVVSPQCDVYAAGLILYELAFGQRANAGADVYQALHRAANEAVVLPESAAVDEGLRALISKACARDANLRFQSAQQMKEALEAWLKPKDAGVEEVGDKKGGGTLEFLLRRMRHKSDFPALSEAISAINRLASSEKENVNTLSNSILKDYALTNKILRMVNSAYYRHAGGGSISTVSRAIVVLGFNTIRSIAISLTLFEHLQNKQHANALKEEFLRANFAGILAKDVSAKLMSRDNEEGFICSLFHHLGRLLTQYYFPEEADAIARQIQQQSCSEDVASARVLGIGYEDLGIGVARSWGFPETIVGSMRALPPGEVRVPKTRDERLRVLAGFSNELCAVVENHPPESRASAMSRLCVRFGDSVPVSTKQVSEMLARAEGELAEFAVTVRVNLKQTRLGRQLAPSQTAEQTAVSGATVAEGAAGATLPGALGESPVVAAAQAVDEADGAANGGATGELETVDAQAVMTAGIQDISNSLVDDFSLNDVLRIILETMYRAMGFKRVLMCIRDARSKTMNGRFGFGAQIDEVVKGFRFSLGGSGDIFNIILSRGVDVLISDATDPKIAARIPDWYRRQMGAQTFIVFPLLMKGAPVAMIYADRDKAGEIVISEKELSLLRTLRNQAVLAIKQSR